MGENGIGNLDIVVRLKVASKVLECELEKLTGEQGELGEALLGAIEVIGDSIDKLEKR